MANARAIFWRVPVLIVVGCALISWGASISVPASPVHEMMIGPMLGTMLQQVVFAAAWTAMGPGHWLVRTPLSFGWACLMGTAMAVPMAFIDEGQNPAEVVLFMVVMWLVAQVPMWGVSRLLGLRLRHQPTYVPEPDYRGRQFGIGQLMIFTACVAVLLGAGRLLIGSQLVTESMQRELPFVAFLLAAQLVMSLPLIIATLLPRRVVVGVIVGLLLMVGVTCAEIPLAEQFTGGGDEDVWIFSLLNLTSALWVFAFAAVVRWSGYHFGVPNRALEVPVRNSTTATEPAAAIHLLQ